jgi:hypothetical protein
MFKKENILDENNVLQKDIIIARVNQEFLPTDTWYQLIKGAYEFCYDFTNKKLEQLKEIQSKRAAGLLFNCIPIINTKEICILNYLARVSIC